MKTVILDGTPWRVRSRSKFAMVLVPLHSDNGRKLLLRDDSRVGGSGTDRWGYTDDIPGRRHTTWYRETLPDNFVSVSPRR